MKIREITVGKSVTVMPQEYQPIKIDASFTATLGDNEPHDQAIQSLTQVVDRYINEEIDAIME